jgi:glycosyltransferase involved in cell wall biosynthesis
MPHLLVFNRSYYPDLGATGQLLTELCEDLVAHHGWEVTVVAGPPTVTVNGVNGSGKGTGGSAGWGPVRQEAVRGVAVLRAAGTRFPKVRFVGRATNYVSYFASAALAGGWARRPDVVMSLTDPPILGLAALAWARRWRVPFVFLCQDIFPEVARLLEDFRSPTIERVLERVNRLLVRRATRVVALGETMKERLVTLRGADPAKVAVIHNWADRAALGGGVRDSAFAREHGLVGRFIVMHAGNLGLGQGLEALVDAAARLVTDCPNLDVVFVGDGAKRGALESRARDVGARNVRFLPFLPRERMRESYGAADLFVISLKAGLAGFIVPSKLYSILAAGKPYVAAVDDESEVAAIALQYGCGLIAPPGDVGALTDRLRTLYRDRALLEHLAVNAWNASAAFDRPIAVRNYHKILSGLL